MTRNQEPASAPISAGGWKYDPDTDHGAFVHHTPAELAVLAKEHGYDFTRHHRYDPLVVGTPRGEMPRISEERRAAYDAAAAARRAAGQVYAHELDDADLGETAATAWPERSLGLRRDES